MNPQNLYSALSAAFPEDRQACAIETEDGLFYSWSDLERASARIAGLLAASGAGPGDRVVAHVDKSVEALLLYLASLRAGLVFVPLNTAYREAELDYFLGDAEPAIVVCRPADFSWLSRIAFRHGARHTFTLGAHRDGSLLARASAHPDHFAAVSRSGDDLAVLIYTSGTTGRSKGAMLSHANLLSNAQVLREFWGWRKDDVLLHTLPLFHVHGLFVGCHAALIAGCKMIFHGRFEAARTIADLRRATVFMGVPTYYTRLLTESAFNRDCCAAMRLFISGSAPLLAETFDAFRDVTGHTILERYGMSETVMLASNPYDGPRIAGTVGIPLPGVSVRLADLPSGGRVGDFGPIEVRGPNVFSGYWRMEDKTRAEFTSDGYFKTGDVGQWVRPEGTRQNYLSIVGRSKDLIITGGYNVYPKEVESFIDALPGVLESAVIGVPHPDFGEAVTGVVVMRDGTTGDEAALLEALKSAIANFKVPKRIHFVSDLPRNAMGKVQKNVLRTRFGPPA